MAAKKTTKATKKTTGARRRQTVGESIVEGLKQAIAWTRGESDDVRVTLVHVPEVDVREVRTRMGSARRSSRPSSASLQPPCVTGNRAGHARTRRRACCWR